MEATDHHGTDDMGSVCLRITAAPIRYCTSSSSGNIRVDDREPELRNTGTSPSSLLGGMGIRSSQQDTEFNSSKSDISLAPCELEALKPARKHLLSQPSQTLPMTHESKGQLISPDQLVTEVKGIYAGFDMVETKPIEVDDANNEWWQALVALHYTLLHEHHGFFLASQHPSTSASQHPSQDPASRHLAAKGPMPARIRRYGIHSFLEFLRHWLLTCFGHMHMLMNIAYSIMALLYETVRNLKGTWIKHLGDLSHYHMAIGDDGDCDCEVWTGMSRHWYIQASDKFPSIGEPHHLLAISDRHKYRRLQHHIKNLCVFILSLDARDMAGLSRSPLNFHPFEILFDPGIASWLCLERRKTPQQLEDIIYKGCILSLVRHMPCSLFYDSRLNPDQQLRSVLKQDPMTTSCIDCGLPATDGLSRTLLLISNRGRSYPLLSTPGSVIGSAVN